MRLSIHRLLAVLCIVWAFVVRLQAQAADGPLSRSEVIQRVSSAMQANGSTGPFISPEFGMDDPVLGEAWATQFVPAVAFNGTHYLVVWMDYRDFQGTGEDIYGARVAASGLVLDSHGFPICAAVSSQRNPVVAASGGNFLVAWADQRSGLRDIYAAHISAGGTVQQPNGVFIQSFAGDSFAVAGNGTDFLLVWENYSALNGYDILGAKVAGTVLNPGVPPFVISAQPGWERTPAVAASGNDYLVVWQDNRDSTGDAVDIYGARVTGNGDVLEADGFAIAAGAWDESVPAIAGTASNYLVVWEDRRNGIYPDIYGTRVSPAGAVMDASFPVGVGGDYQYKAKVAASGDTYLVAWMASNFFHATTVSSGGTVANTNGTAVSSGFVYSFATAASADGFLLVWDDYSDVFGTRITTSGTREGEDFLISSGPNAEQAPAVAFNGSTYLVVWQDNRDGGDNIYGVRVAADGTILEPAAIPICTAPGSQYSPAVASLNGDFLVVWSDTRAAANSWTDIYGARVQADGFVLDPSGFPISTNLYAQRAVAVAANRDHYLVVWRDNRNCPHCEYEADDIFAARVTPAGLVLDPPGLPVSLAAGSQEAPAVASNGDDFLVVWRDDRNGGFNANIYGALVREGAIIAGDIAISTALGQQRGPEISSDGWNFLVVWRDERNFSTSDFDIYGARLDGNGVVQDTNGIAICSMPQRQAEAAVAFGGANYFVAWQDFRGGNTNQIYGTRVSPGGVVLDGTGLLINPGPLNDDIMALASAGGDNFVVVSEGLRGGAPRALANVVAYSELPPPPPPDEGAPGALNRWRAQYSLPSSNDLFAIAPGGGRLVAGGNPGPTVGPTAMSTNAVDWTTTVAAPGFFSRIDGIAYGQGRFVAVSSGGFTLRSSDGTRWEVQAAPTLLGITYAGGRFVAVGNAGAFFTSTNATNWTFGTTGTNANLFEVAHGNGVFVAVGADGAIRMSTNGLNWTAGVSVTNRISALFGVTYGQGQFVAVGSYIPGPATGGAILTSSNGIDWTVRPCPTTNRLQAVTYADYLFVAVGDNGTVISSRDGQTWTIHSSGTLNHLYGVTYGDGFVVAVGARGTILLSDPLRYSAPRVVRQLPAQVRVFVGGSTNLSVAVIGSSPRYFQWFKDADPIPGANGEILALSNLQESDSGAYSVVVSNAFGSATSQPTALIAAHRVGIIQPPLSQAIAFGGSLNASVLVTGTPPYSFEWRYGPIVLASNVVTEPFNFLSLNNVQTGGTYQVRVRNPAPFIGVARNFIVTLLTDSDGDGLPDDWEAAYGFGTNNPADAALDPDMDGLSNSAEYQAGTDPTNNASYLKIDTIRRAQAPDAVTIHFEAVSNRTVAFTNTLSPAPATRFYRLVTPQAP